MNDNVLHLHGNKCYFYFEYIFCFIIIYYYLFCLKKHKFYFNYTSILVLNIELIYKIDTILYNLARLYF